MYSLTHIQLKLDKDDLIYIVDDVIAQCTVPFKPELPRKSFQISEVKFVFPSYLQIKMVSRKVHLPDLNKWEAWIFMVRMRQSGIQ